MEMLFINFSVKDIRTYNIIVATVIVVTFIQHFLGGPGTVSWRGVWGHAAHPKEIFSLDPLGLLLQLNFLDDTSVCICIEGVNRIDLQFKPSQRYTVERKRKG